MFFPAVKEEFGAGCVYGGQENIVGEVWGLDFHNPVDLTYVCDFIFPSRQFGFDEGPARG